MQDITFVRYVCVVRTIKQALESDLSGHVICLHILEDKTITLIFIDAEHIHHWCDVTGTYPSKKEFLRIQIIDDDVENASVICQNLVRRVWTPVSEHFECLNNHLRLCDMPRQAVHLTELW